MGIHATATDVAARTGLPVADVKKFMREHHDDIHAHTQKGVVVGDAVVTALRSAGKGPAKAPSKPAEKAPEPKATVHHVAGTKAAEKAPEPKHAKHAEPAEHEAKHHEKHKHEGKKHK